MAYTTIKKPSDYFNTKLYTGNGSTNNITGVGFQPDLTWLKVRLAGSGQDHTWYDAVRGATKFIESNTTNAEATGSNYLTSFDSDGFTLGNDQSHVNASGDSYASWNWLANGAGSANTDGTISSTVSANTTSGFSVVSYTGTASNATVGHGLGVAPSMIIVKNRDNGTPHWTVYHKSLGATKWVYLSATDASDTATAMWNATEPTSSVFSLGTWNNGNGSSENMIAYCFADVQGYSKFGSYQGNSSADGTFVYTGFKPAWVVIKRTDATANWHMLDNKRDPINEADATLLANSSGAEFQSSNDVDFLSNGFKLRANQTSTNVGTYIYMAFAEEPLVGDNPATAR